LLNVVLQIANKNGFFIKKKKKKKKIFWKLEPELSGLPFVSDRNYIAKSDDQNFKELKKVCVLSSVLLQGKCTHPRSVDISVEIPLVLISCT
jgi:hypothetical protein